MKQEDNSSEPKKKINFRRRRIQQRMSKKQNRFQQSQTQIKQQINSYISSKKLLPIHQIETVQQQNNEQLQKRTPLIPNSSAGLLKSGHSSLSFPQFPTCSSCEISLFREPSARSSSTSNPTPNPSPFNVEQLLSNCIFSEDGDVEAGLQALLKSVLSAFCQTRTCLSLLNPTILRSKRINTSFSRSQRKSTLIPFSLRI